MRYLGLLPILALLSGCGDSETATSSGSGGSGSTGTETAGSTSTAMSATTAGTATGTGGAGGSFALDVHTELDAAPGLILRVNLPFDMGECVAAPGDPPCADMDGDGLVDAWEDVALDRLRPIQRFDEDESLVGDGGAVLADVGRVAPLGDAIAVFIMLGYSTDYGSCGGFTSHNGDSERVVLELVREEGGGAGDVRVSRAYTAAHEGTASDHGRTFTGAELGMLVHDADPVTSEPRWVVFPSADKHATYATTEICEGISVIPCFDEDCGPDGVADPAAYDALPTYVNAGEEAMPLVTDLTAVGFPGDDAWASQDFCGGLGGGSCSAPVRDKLLVSPF